MQPDGEGEGEQQHGRGYARMPPEPEWAAASASGSFRLPESAHVFEELPRGTIVGVSWPDAGDITPMLLSYTIEVRYKQALFSRGDVHMPISELPRLFIGTSYGQENLSISATNLIDNQPVAPSGQAAAEQPVV